MESVFFSVSQIGNVKGILKNFLIEPFVPHLQVLQIWFNFIFISVFLWVITHSSFPSFIFITAWPKKVGF